MQVLYGECSDDKSHAKRRRGCAEAKKLIIILRCLEIGDVAICKKKLETSRKCQGKYRYVESASTKLDSCDVRLCVTRFPLARRSSRYNRRPFGL